MQGQLSQREEAREAVRCAAGQSTGWVGAGPGDTAAVAMHEVGAAQKWAVGGRPCPPECGMTSSTGKMLLSASSADSPRRHTRT